MAIYPALLELPVGAGLFLQVITPAGSLEQGDLLWVSENPGAATVSPTGYITALAVGQTRVEAYFSSAPGQRANCRIVVLEADPILLYSKDDPPKLSSDPPYLDQLEELEWYVDHDRDYPSARLRNIGLRFQFNSKTVLQISTHLHELGGWPADEMPAEILQPEKDLLLGVDIRSMDDKGLQYYIAYDYDGLEEQDVMDYMLKFVEAGWRGDEYMVSKDIEWNGAMFEASIEPYYDMGMMSFPVNLFRK